MTEPQWETPKKQRKEDESKDNWIWGAVLIIVGGFLLLNTSGIVNLSLINWWAFFILIPALGAFAEVARQYRQAGGWTSRVSSSLVGGCTITLVALTFLLSWDWSRIWPMFLILGGISMLLGGFGRRAE